MNIFVLDWDPCLAARYHCDKHVISQIKEGAQMLSTALGHGYRPTHRNHPCTQWVASNRSNALWLVRLCEALNQEYRLRYNHDVDHKSWSLICTLLPYLNTLKAGCIEDPAQAMPEIYRGKDFVKAYRTYYWKAKKDLAAWRVVGEPWWWDEKLYE